MSEPDRTSYGFDYGAPPPPPPPPVYPATPSAPPPRRRPGWGILGAVALVLIGAVSGSATTWYLNRQTKAPVLTLQGPNEARNVVLQGNSAAITDVYKRVGPAVVRIDSVSRGQGSMQLGPFGFRSGPQLQKGVGSGFIFDTRGYILTNNHVIAGSQQLTVIFEDGATYKGTVVGADPQGDLAVVKIDPGTRQLTVVSFGDSDKVQIGEPAIAIGTPFELDHTVTSGIISGRNRPVDTGNSQQTGLLQTDAAINPGNSGGPLLDAAGNVIGINTAIESPSGGNVGIGFAIPVNKVKAELPTLLQGKTPDHPRLGIYAQDVSSLGRLANKPDSGVAVVTVQRGSGADQAGLQGATLDPNNNVVRLGDVILAIDGRKLNRSTDITDYLDTKQVGDKVQIEVWNNGKTHSVTITLGALQNNNADQSP